MKNKKRSSNIRFNCQASTRPAALAPFEPITLASLGIDESQLAPLQLTANQDMYIDAVLEVEAEKMAVEFLQEMTHPRNPTRHKQLLEEHTALLRAAEQRLEKRSALR